LNFLQAYWEAIQVAKDSYQQVDGAAKQPPGFST
jgi:hypothetical protein